MMNGVTEVLDSRTAGSAPTNYEPPRITFDEVLEIVAATCTGAGAKFDQGTCPSGPPKT